VHRAFAALIVLAVLAAVPVAAQDLPPGGLFGGDLRVALPSAPSLDPAAFPSNRLVQAVAYGRVRQAELVFHAGDLAFAAHEGFNKIKLLGGKLSEQPDAETAFDGRIAIPAVNAGDGDLSGADRATHWQYVHSEILICCPAARLGFKTESAIF